MDYTYFPLDDIKISPDRQRKYFDKEKLDDLAADIAENDLIHALAVTPTGELICGERRLRAIKSLYEKGIQIWYGKSLVPLHSIPVVVVRERDMEEYYAMELAENTARADLTWQERVDATSRYHTLRAKQKKGAQSLTDTARELSTNPSPPVKAVSDSVILAQYMQDPEVTKQKSMKDAMRVVERKAREVKINMLAGKIKKDVHARHKVILGDAVEELPHLPDESFDVMLTDPPYGIGAQNFGSQNLHPHAYDDSPESWLRLMVVLASESFRITKKLSHAYIFCDIRRWSDLQVLMDAAGWDVWPRPLIWDRLTGGILPRPQHGPRYTYQAILYALKGGKTVLRNGMDVLRYPVPQKSIHAAEKPVELYIDLLRRSCLPGDRVIDPCAGSGTILPAANILSLFATAIEINETFHNTALSRMREGLL